MSHRSRRPRPGPGSLRWLDANRRPSPASSPRRDAGVAWLPSLIAKGPQPLQRAHLRCAPRPAASARLHLIVLDTSGSMRRRGRLALAKGHAAALIDAAARAGDPVGLLSFGGQGVELLLPLRRARAAGSARVRTLGGGGGTPLAQALAEADRLLARARQRLGPVDTWLWLLTDGRTLEQPAAPRAARRIVVVDFDAAPQAIGRCAAWAARWGASYRSAHDASITRSPRPA